ncbi:hypothetical protein [Terrilactibacillus laevilacticus]|uniref:hypothetical protein n=1 Tax=Terrilactibacillus laevilacticus TaxID=1380157 RepID=UPI0011461367|nr:hypothetical protein [Terrilactibacillus laevilacticus]
MNQAAEENQSISKVQILVATTYHHTINYASKASVGDLVLAKGPGSSSSSDEVFWGAYRHIATVATKDATASYQLFSANKSHGDNVHYEKRSWWNTDYSTIVCKSVNVSSAKKTAAFKYMKERWHETYSNLTTKSSTSSWCCSKLMYAGYKHAAGISLDHDGGVVVFPDDISASGYVKTEWTDS